MNLFKRLFKEEDGMGVVEIVLILAIIVGLAIIFKDQITEFVNTILVKILGDAKGIY